jgi:hypothetical protein
MSRHKDLFDSLFERMRGYYDPQTAVSETNELIDGYREEVQREAAARIRSLADGATSQAHHDALIEAADHIDPDVFGKEPT